FTKEVMRNSRTSIRLLAIMFLLGITTTCHAVITAPPALQAVLANYPLILVAKVEKIYPEKPAMVLAVAEDLKGKAAFRSLPINLKGSEEAQKEKHTEILLKRLAPDVPVILFISPRGGKLTTFGFTNGTWFQLQGTETGKDTVAWGFV